MIESRNTIVLNCFIRLLNDDYTNQAKIHTSSLVAVDMYVLPRSIV